MRKWAVAAILLSCAWNASGDERPFSIGRPATREQIDRIALSILPSGKGLPAGRGTARQGRVIYAAKCAECHGGHGEGKGDYPALAGGAGTLATDHPVLTVGSYWPYATTAWDYVRRAMPYDRPGSLPTNDVYALTAFILELNGILKVDDVLDERSLSKVRMPNRDGFVPDPRPDVNPFNGENSGFNKRGTLDFARRYTH